MSELRPIPGYEGIYAVTADGRVWSEPRIVMRRNGVAMTVQGRWLSQSAHSAGYLEVRMRKGDWTGAMLIHRAVALAWLPAPQPGQREVNHKDGDKRNNTVGNLEWCTCADNKRHAWRTGITVATDIQRESARRNGRLCCKLTADQVRALREQISLGVAQKDIARVFGISAATVSLIANNRRYASV